VSVGEVVFYLLGGLAIASAVLAISARNPVASLLLVVLAFFALAGLFATLEAHFLAAIQILVYAGAILVLFLFVIMLLNLGSQLPQEWLAPPSILILASAAGAAFVLAGFFLVRRGEVSGVVPPTGTVPAVGSTEAVGLSLFGDFLLPFEITSLVLLVAMVGAIVLAKRES
jgi:NADH-quinone oxidoreductase subunit J